MLKLTIAIPTFNGGINLERAINSCKNIQLGPDEYEILVVDNCSTDESISNIKIDKSQIDIWQLFGSLRWGVICMMQAFAHLNGSINSIEKAAIGRRVSETEYDLMNMIKHNNFL